MRAGGQLEGNWRPVPGRKLIGNRQRPFALGTGGLFDRAASRLGFGCA